MTIYVFKLTLRTKNYLTNYKIIISAHALNFADCWADVAGIMKKLFSLQESVEPIIQLICSSSEPGAIFLFH